MVRTKQKNRAEERVKKQDTHSKDVRATVAKALVDMAAKCADVPPIEAECDAPTSADGEAVSGVPALAEGDVMFHVTVIPESFEIYPWDSTATIAKRLMIEREEDTGVFASRNIEYCFAVWHTRSEEDPSLLNCQYLIYIAPYDPTVKTITYTEEEAASVHDSDTRRNAKANGGKVQNIVRSDEGVEYSEIFMSSVDEFCRQVTAVKLLPSLNASLMTVESKQTFWYSYKPGIGCHCDAHVSEKNLKLIWDQFHQKVEAMFNTEPQKWTLDASDRKLLKYEYTASRLCGTKLSVRAGTDGTFRELEEFCVHVGAEIVNETLTSVDFHIDPL